MATVGAYEAKTHLAALLARVERGERITITRHGKPVAVLAPPVGGPDQAVDDTIDALLAQRRGRTLGAGVSVRDLIDEGRR